MSVILSFKNEDHLDYAHWLSQSDQPLSPHIKFQHKDDDGKNPRGFKHQWMMS